MKTAKKIISIISIVLFIVITFQSCAAGLGNAIQGNGGNSGSAGLALATFMLIAGIIGVAMEKSKGGTITAACFYGVGGLIGISNVGIYTDLNIWSTLSFVFAVVFIISIIFRKEDSQ